SDATTKEPITPGVLFSSASVLSISHAPGKYHPDSGSSHMLNGRGGNLPLGRCRDWQAGVLPLKILPRRFRDHGQPCQALRGGYLVVVNQDHPEIRIQIRYEQQMVPRLNADFAD